MARVEETIARSHTNIRYFTDLVRGVVVNVEIPFEEPHTKNSYLEVGIGKCGGRDLSLKAISRTKDGRWEVGSGDSLVTTCFNSNRGVLVLADERDGFTPIDADDWWENNEKKRVTVHSADLFYAQTNSDFVSSNIYKRWATETAKFITHMPSKIRKVIPNHANLDTEGILKEVLRSYLEAKNDFRSIFLRGLIKTRAGREIVNGTFDCTAMWLPKELGQVSDGAGVGAKAQVGAVAVCRSLADTVSAATMGNRKFIWKVDANAYVDEVFMALKSLMSPDKLKAFKKKWLYEKVNRTFAAEDFDGINLALTEEEQVSLGILPGAMMGIRGTTDGGLRWDDRNKPLVGVEAMLDENVRLLREDPQILNQKLGRVKDDVLIYDINLQ